LNDELRETNEETSPDREGKEVTVVVPEKKQLTLAEYYAEKGSNLES